MNWLDVWDTEQLRIWQTDYETTNASLYMKSVVQYVSRHSVNLPEVEDFKRYLQQREQLNVRDGILYR